MINLLRKDWFELNTILLRSFAILLCLIWSLCFLVYLQAYQAESAKLASLSIPRGASDILLAPMNILLIWLLFFWVVFATSKLIGMEFQHGSHSQFNQKFTAWLSAKFLTVAFSSLFLLLPFWSAVCYLSHSTHFDVGLLSGIFASQCLMVIYSTLLLCLLNLLLKQVLASILLSILLIIFLWIAPNLVSSPQGLVDMMLWLSPFAHITLLSQGLFSLQTLIFIFIHSAFFMSLIIFLHLKDH